MTDARLLSLSKRINAALDRVDEERAHVRDLYDEAKAAGYIPKILRKAITRQRMDASKRQEEDSILDLYDHALGNVGKALEAISKGATWEEAGNAHGVRRATLARAAAVSKRREMIPDHDPETGEVQSGGGNNGEAPVAVVEAEDSASPVQPAGPPTFSPESSGPPVRGCDGDGTAASRPLDTEIDLTIPPFLKRERAA